MAEVLLSVRADPAVRCLQTLAEPRAGTRARQFLTATADVSFEIRGRDLRAGRRIGSGKSTIAKMIVGLLPPSRAPSL
jgi:ABC-type antimicrobial peptide transport system ATPase subunit